MFVSNMQGAFATADEKASMWRNKVTRSKPHDVPMYMIIQVRPASSSDEMSHETVEPRPIQRVHRCEPDVEIRMGCLHHGALQSHHW